MVGKQLRENDLEGKVKYRVPVGEICTFGRKAQNDDPHYPQYIVDNVDFSFL